MKILCANVALAITLITLITTGSHACGMDTDCKIGDRTYRIALPSPTSPEKPGAIIFNHGYRGTAAGIMKNKRLVKTVTDMGLALVAPKSFGPDWDIPNSPSPGDNVEFDFFAELKEDLTSRHGIDTSQIMISGFSAGGMMTWNLACEMGNSFAAYAPMAGTFWAPVPKNCNGLPVNMIHMHGTDDKIVPMKGRPIANTRQGDVYKALKMAAEADDFGKWNSTGESHGLTCQRRTASSGRILELCVHPGGHTIRSEWLVKAWKTFSEAGVLKPAS